MAVVTLMALVTCDSSWHLSGCEPLLREEEGGGLMARGGSDSS